MSWYILLYLRASCKRLLCMRSYYVPVHVLFAWYSVLSRSICMTFWLNTFLWIDTFTWTLTCFTNTFLTYYGVQGDVANVALKDGSLAMRLYFHVDCWVSLNFFCCWAFCVLICLVSLLCRIFPPKLFFCIYLFSLFLRQCVKKDQLSNDFFLFFFISRWIDTPAICFRAGVLSVAGCGRSLMAGHEVGRGSGWVGVGDRGQGG